MEFWLGDLQTEQMGELVLCDLLTNKGRWVNLVLSDLSIGQMGKLVLYDLSTGQTGPLGLCDLSADG